MHPPAGEEDDRQQQRLLPDRNGVDVAEGDEEKVDRESVDRGGVRSLGDARIEAGKVRVGDGVQINREYQAGSQSGPATTSASTA